MNKLTAIEIGEVCDYLDLHLGTIVFISGATTNLRRQVFNSEQIKHWVGGLKVKHPDHPVIKELKEVDKFLKRNKIDLVIC